MTELDLAGLQQVKFQEVEKQLRAMWGATAEAEDAEHSRPVIRACALNLVVYVADRTSLPRMLAAIDQVSLSIPSRAIVLVTDPQKAGDDLTTYIKSVCRLPDASGRRLCCEQVVVVGGVQAGSVIHSAIDPLLVPDLPVYLWWNYRPEFDGPLFEKLARAANRLIVDTEVFDREAFGRLVDFVPRGCDDLAISDLNWGRLTRWRQILAQLYDSAQYRNHLAGLQRMDVEWISNGAFPVRPLLLTAWMAGRLKWNPQGKMEGSGNSIRMQFGSAVAEISVVVTLRSGPVENSAIVGVELHTADGADFLLKKLPDQDFTETTVKLPGIASNVMVGEMTKIELEEILSQELEVLDRDWVYEEALRMAARLI
ncbi:MAG TPA: glucose-6-phosphate dehydrogenase assembly protein OpcA [Acidobacteriota bacterium]|nr:glucose-6-phosphate dehydrogenase assembly protein OpcA [Acidobacteriota bacterium]